MSDMPDGDRSALFWFLSGMRGLLSVPALVLMTSYIGFSAFALEAGLTRWEAVFMTLMVWALPAQIILVGTMVSNAHIAASFIAVTLSSIRMMPMVASLMPEIRTKRTPVGLLLFLSHFIAITAWVFAMQNLRNVPREHRAIYFAGFGLTLTSTSAMLVGVSYGVVSEFPPILSSALVMLTPVYFVSSIWASAREVVVKLSFVLGVVLGPLLALVIPDIDVLAAGLGGGTAAYAMDRMRRKRRKAVA